MKPYEMVEHTADISVRVFGATLEELFAGAALALTAYLFGEEAATADEEGRESFSLSAPDSESLLVDWLSQLLFLSTSKYRAYFNFDIKIEGGASLSASAGYRAAAAKEDIKAVTYHGLEIVKGARGYEALITFDI